jgi:hypothetical protein
LKGQIGLWETWNPKDEPENIYKSCAIITIDFGECFENRGRKGIGEPSCFKKCELG